MNMDWPTGSVPVATVNGVPVYLTGVGIPITPTMTVVITIKS
jgi:hypothetical protein